MCTNTILIKFIDGEMLAIDSISDFGINNEGRYYYLVRNKYKMMFNADEVKYIGREFDLNKDQGGD